jgi:pantetheine-phosphate adenylyltransferase
VKKKIAIYPGSFDPITNGHLDIIARAAKIFDEIVVAVTSQDLKKPLFSIEERIEMLEQAVSGMKNVRAESFSGLLVDYARRKRATAIIRGLRAVSDFEYEFQMALMNRRLSRKNGNLFETVYLMPDEKYTYLSSTLVKEVSKLGGSVVSFVPRFIEKELLKKFGR